MYSPAPKEKGAAGGFDLSGYYEQQGIEVWPENWPVIDLFIQLGTQWRVGMCGPTGLVYEAVYGLLDRKGLEGDDWLRMFDDLRILEREALNAMRGD